jgi:hypothetical protein
MEGIVGGEVTKTPDGCELLGADFLPLADSSSASQAKECQRAHEN